MRGSKRCLCFFRVVVSFLIVISLLPGASVSASKSVKTGVSGNNFIDFQIEGNTLKVTGVVKYDELAEGWVQFSVGAHTRKKFTAEDGKAFSLSLTLPETVGKFSVQVYFAPKNSDYYYGYLTGQVVIEYDESKGYYFVESPVLENNVEMLSGWINPYVYVSEVSPNIKAQSDSIVNGKKSDYDKVFAIYEWVVKNIYYDFDYYYEKTDSTTTSAEEVLISRRSVCEGYAKILQALIHAQGIPAVITSTYALGASTDGNPFSDSYVNASDANHSHVEAFADGRWITMDATWDSNNQYHSGRKIATRPYGYLYFDISPELFAMNHKILKRETASIDDIPAEWAKEEVFEAICQDIVPAFLQSGYREKISRGDFCKLIIQMLCRRYEVENSAELLELFTVAQAENIFIDTNDNDVIAANLLGIVDGRGEGIFDPSSGITRQEAAVMLSRAAKVIGLETNANSPQFTDTALAASWAAKEIGFIASLMSADGKLVMGGTSENTFSPFDSYTVEQSIVTMWRLFSCE